MAEQQRRSISEYRILALYRFTPLVISTNHPPPSNNNNDDDTSSSWDDQSLMKHPERHPQLLQLQSELYATLRRYETRGTLLIAPEGINGTICYPYPPPLVTATATACAEGSDDAINVTVQDGTKYDNNEEEEDDDPVKSFICNHPLFGGEGLRTRSSVWKEHPDNDKCIDSNANNNSRPQQAFQRLKIKIKPEIVTLGLGRPITNPITHTPSSTDDRHVQNQLANPNITKGHYLNPRQWDDAMKDPNVLVIDTRNSYEIDIGTFESAVDPQTQHFSEFPDYLTKLAGEYDWDYYQEASNNNQGRMEQDGNGDGKDNEATSQTTTTTTTTTMKKPPPKAIAMFCTGGIRCEKATSYALQSNLFPSNLPIYHLEGGILSYLDDVAKRKEQNDGKGEGDGGGEVGGGGGASSSTFHGECFVFDKRVALTEGLEPSNKYISCHGCRGPMDRRLLEDIPDAGIGATNDDTTSTMTADLKAKKREYDQLLMGIRNLPPLTYDKTTQRWYVPGLTCPRCHDGTTRESFERFAQRKEQMEICAREGKSHFQDNGRKS